MAGKAWLEHASYHIDARSSEIVNLCSTKGCAKRHEPVFIFLLDIFKGLERRCAGGCIFEVASATSVPCVHSARRLLPRLSHTSMSRAQLKVHQTTQIARRAQLGE